MAEKSSLGIVQIILHIICGLLCLGVLVASAIALSTISDIEDDFEIPDDSEAAGDRDRYRGTAGWLLFVGIAGIVIQLIMVIVHALYYTEAITAQFTVFGVLNIIFSILLALGLLAGGIASAVNAANVQNDLDDSLCDESDQLPPSIQELCDNTEQLRNSQAADAALSLLGTATFGVLTVIVLVSIATRKNGTV